jgi:hypothetical protein
MFAVESVDLAGGERDTTRTRDGGRKLLQASILVWPISRATVSTLGGYNTRLGMTKSETMLSVILQPMLSLVI